MYEDCNACNGTGQTGSIVKLNCYRCHGEKKVLRYSYGGIQNETPQATANIWLVINTALHDPKITQIKINNQQVDIKIGTNDCRFIRWNNKTFMEQNKNKDSYYAKQARNGQEITWVMKSSNNGNNSWGLIIDGKIKRY